MRHGFGWTRQPRISRLRAELAADDDIPPRLAAFLAHLAAEKALKAALIARGIAIRKIHDLVEL